MRLSFQYALASPIILVCILWINTQSQHACAAPVSGVPGSITIDHIIGYPELGNQAYSNYGVAELGHLELIDFGNRGILLSDPVTRTAYSCGEFSNLISKFDLAHLAWIGNLTLPIREITRGFVDSQRRVTYLANEGGDIAKLDLTTFTNASKLSLKGFRGKISSVVFDATDNIAYFATNSDPGQIVKVDLNSFSQVGILTLNSGQRYISCGVLDEIGRAAFFGTDSPPGYNDDKIIKIDLTHFTQAGSLQMLPHEGYLADAGIDPNTRMGYFCSGGYPTVVQIDLANFHRVTAVTGNAAWYGISRILVDPTEHAAFLAGMAQNTVAKLDFSTMSFSAGDHVLSEGNNYGALESRLVPDPTSHTLFITTEFPGEAHLVEIDMNSLKRVNSMVLPVGESYLKAALVDPDKKMLYVGTQSYPGRVVKIDLTTFSRVGQLAFDANAEENDVRSAVIDPSLRAAYFGVDVDGSYPVKKPARIIKVDLDTFKEAKALSLNEGESDLTCAVIDIESKAAYFGTNTSPARIIKVDLPTLTRVNALTLEPGENQLNCAVVDTGNKAAYFATATSPSTVVKIDLDSFKRSGAIQLAGGGGRANVALINPGTSAAYFGTYSRPSRLIKVDLKTFAQTDLLTFNPDEGYLMSAIFDQASGFAALGTISGKIVMVDLNNFKRVSATILADDQAAPVCGIFDPVGGKSYFGTQSTPGIVACVEFTHRNLLDLTRLAMPEEGDLHQISLYSHLGIGHVRLGIYREDSPSSWTLVWQSPAIENFVNEGFITVPAEQGFPGRVKLAPGNYALAWQMDTDAPVPDASAGQLGDGAFLALPFAPFPTTLSPLDTSNRWNVTDRHWTGYLSYLTWNGIPAYVWMGY